MAMEVKTVLQNLNPHHHQGQPFAMRISQPIVCCNATQQFPVTKAEAEAEMS
jgi:hypothetical protein